MFPHSDPLEQNQCLEDQRLGTSVAGKRQNRLTDERLTSGLPRRKWSNKRQRDTITSLASASTHPDTPNANTRIGKTGEEEPDPPHPPTLGALK